MRENVRKRGLQLHQSRIAFARPMARLEEIMRDRGIEPRSPGWKPGVVPLDQSRGVIEIKAEGERVEPSRLVARPISNQVPSPFGLPFPISRRLDRRGVEPRFPGCKPGVVPLDQQPNSSSTGGSRTHRHQSLDLIAMPIRVPCRRSLNATACHSALPLRARESNRGVRAYETRPSTGPPACPRPRYRSG